MRRRGLVWLLACTLLVVTAAEPFGALCVSAEVTQGESAEKEDEPEQSEEKEEKETEPEKNGREEEADEGNIAVDGADRAEKANIIGEENALVATDKFSGKGDGSSSNPYQITNANQLNEVRNNLSAHYELESDIDLSGISNWVPIGDNENPFIGSLNGNNYTIKNLKIDYRNIGFIDYVGLFGKCTNVTIKNVHLSDVSINVDKTDTDYTENGIQGGCVYVGGIIAYGIGGYYMDYLAELLNCTISGKITVSNCNDAYVGGIIGCGSEPVNCINYVDISVLSNRNGRYENDGTVQCGGIIGMPGVVYGKIENCSNHGKIKATAGKFLYCGGISGEDGAIRSCINYAEINGQITQARATSSFAENCNVGGVVGATSAETLYSVNYGNISGYAKNYGSVSVGGIAVHNGYYGSGTIHNCINAGQNIKSLTQRQSGDTYIDSDGNAGRISGTNIGIQECYSLNTTVINDTLPTDNIGTTEKNGASLSKKELSIKIATLNSSSYEPSEEDTRSNNIYTESARFTKAINDYYSVVTKRFKSDAQKANSAPQNFKQLRAYDEKAADRKTNQLLSIEATAPDAAVDDAYEVLYDFLKKCLQIGDQEKLIDLDIDTSQSAVEIEAKVVNKIFDAMKEESGSYKGQAPTGLSYN